MIERICRTCDLPKSEFPRKGSGFDGECKDCNRARGRARYHTKVRQVGQCLRCERSYPYDKDHGTVGLCRSCRQAGANNVAWKGGHRYWQDGKYGRDKDGLSWKVQRKLAWERDNYRCRVKYCDDELTPHVHHVVPYRISKTHALDNLVCLCASHHKQADQLYDKVGPESKLLWEQARLEVGASQYGLEFESPTFRSGGVCT